MTPPCRSCDQNRRDGFDLAEIHGANGAVLSAEVVGLLGTAVSDSEEILKHGAPWPSVRREAGQRRSCAAFIVKNARTCGSEQDHNDRCWARLAPRRPAEATAGAWAWATSA